MVCSAASDLCVLGVEPGCTLPCAWLQVACGMKEVRDRIASVKNTSKITEVSAALRSARDSALGGQG